MFMLGASSTAFAQSTDEGYNPVGPILLQDANGSNPSDRSNPSNQSAPNVAQNAPKSAQSLAPNQRSENGGNLPFTGLDVALLAGAGGLLLIMGFGMRRLTRMRESSA